jgi:hypothetical protein
VTHTTAKPIVYHLRIRLIDSHGVPFHDHEFRVRWGKDQLRGTTTGDGMIVLQVDGGAGIDGGTLELGNLKGATFVPSIVIPLVKHEPERTVDLDERTPFGSSRTSAKEKSYDIAWRLANLMYLSWIPAAPTFGSIGPAPAVPGATKDAMLRFKAHNHEILGLTDWLQPERWTSPARLTSEQDDESVKLLLVQHDHITGEEAAKKLHDAKVSLGPTVGGSPL